MTAVPSIDDPAQFLNILFVCGIVAFGVRPNDPDASLASRAASGALFGLLAYATWGLTGVAVLKGFPWGLALLDMAWGAVASVVVTAVTATILGTPQGARVRG